MNGGTLYMVCLCLGAFALVWWGEVTRKPRD